MLPCTRLCFLPVKQDGPELSAVSFALMAESYKRFGPLFLEFVRMIVSSGLAGARVQPCPRNTLSF
jgi:hypothetical protein